MRSLQQVDFAADIQVSESEPIRSPSEAPVIRRKRTEGGAALVEAAIVFIPLCIIVFGIIEYGFIFKDSLTLSSATRAGARTASAEPRQPSFLEDTQKAVIRAASAANFSNTDQMWIYKADPNGNPSPADCSSNCAIYQWNGSTWLPQGGGTWDYNTQQTCLGGPVDSVGVRLTLFHKSITGLLPFTTVTLKEHTVMRLEPLTQADTSGNCS